MSLSWLSPAAFFAGLAAIAGVLFALQRLRVRHRTVTVPTTQFWREASENTRARVFVQRFRHPLAYLLLLAIASLAWLAVAGPQIRASAARERVLVLDASARMAIGSRFATALSALEDRVARLPRGETRVVVAGAQVRTLLDRGEDWALLAQRARTLAPEACPSTLARALEDVCAAKPVDGIVDVEIFGDSPLDPRLIALHPSAVHVHRAASEAQSVSNSGIVALGVSEALSGAWNRIDVLIEVRGPAGQTAHVTLDGVDTEVAWKAAPEPGVVSGVLRDVEANGGRMVASVDTADALALDDRASLVLPTRPALRVALSPTVPSIVAVALRSDPGVAIVDGAADVVVRTSGESFGGQVPSLVLTEETAEGAAFVVHHPATRDPDGTLRAAFGDVGLDEIDALELAQRASRPITLALETSTVRGISMWGALLAPPYDFTNTRSFPLFVARAVRWLGSAPSFAATEAAGIWTLGAREPWTDARGTRIDTNDAEARYPRAGEIVTSLGFRQAVSLLDTDVTRLRDDAVALPDVDRSGAGSSFDPLVWIVLTLLALLLVEWWLVRAESIP